MQSLAFSSIKTLRELLDKKQISAAELLQYSINRFKTYDQKVGSALEVFDEKSIQDKSPRSGILAGIPGILKDNIAQEGRALNLRIKNFNQFYRYL